MSQVESELLCSYHHLQGRVYFRSIRKSSNQSCSTGFFTEVITNNFAKNSAIGLIKAREEVVKVGKSYQEMCEAPLLENQSDHTAPTIHFVDVHEIVSRNKTVMHRIKKGNISLHYADLVISYLFKMLPMIQKVMHSLKCEECNL